MGHLFEGKKEVVALRRGASSSAMVWSVERGNDNGDAIGSAHNVGVQQVKIVKVLLLLWQRTNRVGPEQGQQREGAL